VKSNGDMWQNYSQTTMHQSGVPLLAMLAEKNHGENGAGALFQLRISYFSDYKF